MRNAECEIRDSKGEHAELGGRRVDREAAREAVMKLAAGKGARLMQVINLYQTYADAAVLSGQDRGERSRRQ